MLSIRLAAPEEFTAVRAFYHHLIDLMQGAAYSPGWQKDVYPSDAYLLQSLQRGELYLGMADGQPVAAMIMNHSSNEGYHQVTWPTQAEDGEITVLHALGVVSTHCGKGYAKALVRFALQHAREHQQKVVRLDVLAGNLPASRLYAGLGFQLVATLPMFYEDTGWTDYELYEYKL